MVLVYKHKWTPGARRSEWNKLGLATAILALIKQFSYITTLYCLIKTNKHKLLINNVRHYSLVVYVDFQVFTCVINYYYYYYYYYYEYISCQFR